MEIRIEALEPSDAAAVADLHRAAARASRGLARRPDEVTEDIVRRTLQRAADGGLALGAWDGERLAGEIHVLPMGAAIFSHVWTELTVAVHPDWQGRGVGRSLFEALFAAARARTPAIERIELFTAAGNQGAQRLYESLGFRREGRFEGRIRYPDGEVDDDIAMAVSLCAG